MVSRRPWLTGRGHRTAGCRGSAYVAVLVTASLVIVLGIGALTATRVIGRTSRVTSEAVGARYLAAAAVDLTLWHIREHPATWRQDLAEGVVVQRKAFGGGTLTVRATDPVDGDLVQGATDKVVLVGEGALGDARRLLEVTLSGDGVPITGTWRSASD